MSDVTDLDTFKEFSSRFTVFEDASECELHLPEEISEICEGCGGQTAYAVYVAMRRSEMLESLPSMDRVGSEYRIFGLPLCANCVPEAKKKETSGGCMAGIGACFNIFIAFVILALGAFAIFYYGFFVLDIGGIETQDPDTASWNMMIFIGALIGWVIVYVLLLYLFNYLAGFFRPGDRGRGRRYRAVIDKFIEKQKLDRYQYLHHADAQPISQKFKIEKFVQQSYHLWGLTYLFRKQWKPGSQLSVFNRTVYELSSNDYKSWGESLSRDRECCGCSKPVSKSHKLMAYRGVAAKMDSGLNGLAREYGVIELPLCSKCVFKDGGIVNSGKPLTWKNYAHMIVPILVTIIPVIMVSSWIYNLHLSGSIWVDIFLKVVLIFVAVIMIFALGIIVALKLVDMKDSAWKSKYNYKKLYDVEPVQRAINSGWGVGAIPDETELELSVNLKYWLDRVGVDLQRR